MMNEMDFLSISCEILQENQKIKSCLEARQWERARQGIDRIESLTQQIIIHSHQKKLIDATTRLTSTLVDQEKELRNLKKIRLDLVLDSVWVENALLNDFSFLASELMKSLVQFCVESAEERKIRDKGSTAVIKVKNEVGLGTQRLFLICDGNGLIPPMSKSLGEKMAYAGMKATFTGKPGAWGAWILEFAVATPVEKCVLITVEGQYYLIPSKAFRLAPSSQATFKIDAYMDIAPSAPTNTAYAPVAEIEAGLEKRHYSIEQVFNEVEVYPQLLFPSLNPENRFLGIASVPQVDQYLLILNPAFLVYGSLKERPIVEGAMAS